MGTKVHCRSYLPGFCSMRDLNEDSSSSSWHVFYGDNTVTNRQYCNGYTPRNSINCYPGHHEKEALKQKMLEHEAVFKTQVSELHRLYKVQRDMMEEIKRTEMHKHRASMEPASSSSLQGSQMPSEDNRKWHMAGFSLLTSSYGRTPTSEIELAKSPMSCTRGDNTQLGQFQLQNGPTSKDAETTDSRPSKVRKKLFDLHLPAEEYIDTEEGEKLPENKVSDVSGYACNGNASSGPESSMKLLLDNCAGVRADCRNDASASASCLRGPIGLADLNDPAQIDEAMAPSSVDFFGRTSQNGEARGVSQPTKPNAGYSSFDNKVNEGTRFSHVFEAGSTRGNHSLVGQGHPPVTMPLPTHQIQGILNQFHHPSVIYSMGYTREDRWKEGRHGLEISDRTRERPSNGHLGPVTPQTTGSYPFSSSSYVANSWDQSASPWPKPTNSFAQSVIPLEASLNSVAAMSKSFQPSAQSQEPFGGKWHVKASSRLNPGLRINPKQNGFYEASASGSKELQVDFQSASKGCLNHRRGDDLVSNHSTNHIFGNFQKGSCNAADSKPVIDINLNEAVSKSSSDEVVILQDLNTNGKRKHDDHLEALPWLKPKPACVNDAAECHKNVNVSDLNQHFPPKSMLASSDCENARNKEIAETQTVKKLLGFPIFEAGLPANQLTASERVDCIPEAKNSHNERKNRMIDINVACEPDEVVTEESTVDKDEREKGAHVRDYIDLNSCASDFEDPPEPCYDRKSASVKKTLEIDLEAPASVESDDDNNILVECNFPSEVSVPSLEIKNEYTQDEVPKDAVEMLVAISSSCSQLHTGNINCLPSGPSLDESVLWFADAVASCANELDNTSGKESRFKHGMPQQDSPKVDEFETMTLQLPKTKEEDYMPTPFVPEVEIVDDMGSNALPARSRRGPSRRGRQRRDFQRDILPGLASLSRHEVTEDLQTFAGIMRATGHSWSSGLTRRNGTRGGGARGRRRAVAEPVPTAIPTQVTAPPMQPQFTNIEAGLEDRSLMGWGKTTRRPRRQRCPAGNHPIALT